MDLEGMRKLTASRMEGHAMFTVKLLMRETASRDLLTWSERKFKLRCLYIQSDICR
jgi:hypothetical protein